MKRASLKEVAEKGLADKEQFIFTQGNTPLNNYRGIEGDSATEVKKSSCYIPVSLWLKYKTYELDQAKKGKSVSFNGLVVDSLTERLKNY
jgi:hypothetical protein